MEETVTETLTWCCVRYIPFIFMTASNGSLFLEVDTQEGYKYLRIRLWKICLMDCGVYIRFYSYTPIWNAACWASCRTLNVKGKYMTSQCCVGRHIFLYDMVNHNGMHQNKTVEGSQARGVNKYKNLRQNGENWPHLNQRVRLDREEHEEWIWRVFVSISFHLPHNLHILAHKYDAYLLLYK